MNSIFSEQILADKLNKLNSTQQCIETLSHWCIFHRQKAEQVVQTWDKQFHSSDQQHKIPFLYLANDILQNSRRKGTEFVEEFWKVLPKALKDVVENGDDRGKNTVSRLVEIWEERKVFGSRARGLKDLMLGNKPLAALELSNGNNKKRLRSVRILRKDSRSIKIKLSIGGTAEKIVSAFHAVLSDHPTEDVDLKKCQEAVHHVGKMEKDVDTACSLQGNDPQRAVLADKLQEESVVLKECVDSLKSVEGSREALVCALKEALREQESQLENVRTQLQVAQAQIEEAANMRRRLNNEPVVATTNSLGANSTEGPKKSAAAIAAEVADKLAASTHSQQIMTSVLSTFAAEEAKNAGLTPRSQPAPVSGNPSKKRVNLENSVQLQPVSVTTAQQYQTVLLPQSSVQNPPSTSTHQYQTVILPQPSVQNPPSTSTPQFAIVHTSPAQHYMQHTGGQMMIGVPYAYGGQPQQMSQPNPQQIMTMARPQQLAQPQPQPMGLIQPSQMQMAMTLQQPMAVNQPVPLNMQHVPPPNYRPLQPPGMNFFHQQSQ